MICTYSLDQRVQNIRLMIQMFQPRSWISVRMMLRHLGLKTSYIPLVKHARWHMQALQWDLKSRWAQYQEDLSDQVQILEETAVVDTGL